MVKARAIARFVRISPRRAMEVIDLIRWKTAEDALNILTFTHKKAAGIALKVLRSAISNATNKDSEAKPEDLIVVDAYVGEGPRAKRYYSRAMGRADVIRHRTSHICIVVSGKDYGSES